MTDATRPNLVLAVAGTGTEVGKTWLAVALVGALREQGWTVSARKPAQSFDPHDPAPHDADLLAAATDETADEVCPPHRGYPIAMAPPMAAAALGLAPFDVAALTDEISGSWPQRRPDVGIVELAGGVASPMASDGDGVALCDALSIDTVVLVADAALGVINSVRLSVAALLIGSDELDRDVVVHLNRHDPDDDLHHRNCEWLRDVDGLTVTTTVDELAPHVIGCIPTFCGGCGRPSTECAGDCRRPLDPDRHCTRCGRTTVVRIIPTGHHATCKIHGPI